MSNLWQQQADGVWKQLPLDAVTMPGLHFCRFGRGADRGVALIAAADVQVWINGLPVPGGLGLLEHKDEILLNGARLYFSAETRPEPTTFHPQAGIRTPSCPVCRGPMKDGDAAVQCPGCGRWFHQLAAKPCWTYAPTCRFCAHPTALTDEATWRPELEDAHV